MRTLTLSAALALTMLALAACKREAPPPPEPSAADFGVLTEPLEAGAGETLMTFDIEGMVCMGCVETIEGAAKGVPGVKKASVNLEQKKAWVIADAASAPEPQQIIDAIEAMQYHATLAQP